MSRSQRFRVNLDYEYDLANHHLNFSKRCKLCSTFEFLAFLADPSLSFFTHKEYDSEYVNYLQEVSDCQLDLKIWNNQPCQNYWGRLQDIENEKFLNSKVTSKSWEKELSISRDSFVLEKISDLEKLPKTKKWILKSEWGFSGRHLSGDDFKKKSLWQMGRVLAEPKDEIVNEYGTLVDQNGLMNHFLNFSHGEVYKGARLIEDFKYANDFKPVALKLLEKIKDSFQVDSYEYNENDKTYFRALVEVNYRKTMNNFLKKFKDKWHADTLVILSQKEIEIVNPYSFDKDFFKRSNWTMNIAPKGSPFWIFIGHFNEKLSYEEIKREILHKFSK